MTSIDTIKAVKEYGITSVFIILFYITNARVEKVEDKLADCFNDRIEEIKTSPFRFPTSKKSNNFRLRPLAILPEDPIGKIKKV